MIVRPEGPDDRTAIHSLHAAAFASAGEARLVDALRSAEKLAVSLVAHTDGRVVGHVALSPVQCDGKTIGLGLAPVAVLPEYRRRGIARLLIESALGVCRERNVGLVVVLGEPAYYARFGFKPAEAFGLADEYGGGDAFQGLELLPGTIPAGGGLVRYASEFAILDGDDAAQ